MLGHVRYHWYRATIYVLWRSCIYICAYISFVQGIAYLLDRTAEVISPLSVFNYLPHDIQWPVGALLILFGVIAVLKPYPAGFFAVFVGGFLRLFDTVHQGSWLGIGFYLLLVAFALMQLLMERTVQGLMHRGGPP